MPQISTNAGDPSASRFVTTRWSTVAVAGDVLSLGAQAALERLCQDYWRALLAFALRQGRDLHTAQDLTQAFFAHFIERGYVRAADRTRGRFRTFLLTCFEHFLVHEWEKSQAAKRGGRFVLVSWDDHSAALETRAVTSTEVRPERLYDLEWALTIMERALASLQSEFAATGREEHFQVLKHFLHSEASAGEYIRIGDQLGLTDRAVKLAVHRLRRRYGRLVRDEVRETVTNEADVDDELRYLVELMSA